MTLLGYDFAETGQVELTPIDGGETQIIDAVTVEASGTSATFSVTAGSLPAGLYRVTFLGDDGSELPCGGHLLVSPQGPPTVSDVIPPFAWTGIAGDGELSDQRVEVIGEGFLITPSIRFVSVDDPSVNFEATTVNYISTESVNAICPSETREMPAGDYHVFAVNPNGLEGQWIDEVTGDPGIFEVTEVPPPRIDSIDPIRSPASDPADLTVTGAYFQDGAVVSIGREGTDPLALTTTNDADRPDEVLHAAIPASSLAQGPHPVIVTNPDERHDVYYSFDATPSSSGHLAAYEEVEAELVTARERHAVATGFDSFGGAFIYVAGGLDSDGVVLDDAEVIGVNAFGALEAPRVAEQFYSAETPRGPNVMSTPRNGLTLVRVGRTLYAIGGSDVNTRDAADITTSLATVERAAILGYEQMPMPILPTSGGGSGLPIGTWYYRVSALGPWGESLPSREVQLRNEGGQLTFCWHEVEGATGYNVYRNFDAAGLSGTTRLMATNVSGSCYEDDGRGVNQPAPGRLRGNAVEGAGLAVGDWVYRVTAVVGGEETVAGNRLIVPVEDLTSGQVSLRWSPVPDATYNLYRTPAALDPAEGDELTFLLAEGLTDTEYVDDGLTDVDLAVEAPDGIRGLMPGSLSRWEELPVENDLIDPREGLDAVALTVPCGADDCDDVTYIYATGGRPDSSGEGYFVSTERAPVLEGGELGPWEAMGHDMNQSRAFFVLLTNVGQRETETPPPPEEPPCEDLDGDGHNEPRCGDDCDDTDPDVYPGAPEICGDGIDQDCDGEDPPCECEEPTDADGDGHLRPECGGDDCDDTDPDIYPGAPEICGDGIDQDCDGADEECDCPEPSDQDGDGHMRPECGGDDCDDLDDTIYPGAEEICDDGIDQDCDGADLPCLISFMGQWTEPGRMTWLAGPELAADPTPMIPRPTIAAGPLYLIACQGDDTWTGGGDNSGTTTTEVTEILEGSGDLTAWTLQPSAELSGGQATHGHGALLYFDYLFIMKGVQRELADAPPEPYNSTASRFEYHEGGIGADVGRIFEGRQSTSATFVTPRAYFGMTRIASFIFAIGGSSDLGPVSTIERLHQ